MVSNKDVSAEWDWLDHVLQRICLKEKWNLQVMYYEALVGQYIMKL